MQVTKLDFPAPLLVIDDFMSAEDAAACLQECIDLKPVYWPGSVGFGAQNRKDPTIRRNDVVMLQTVLSGAPDRSKIITLLDKRIKECNALWHDGYYVFDLINYANWKEYVLSRYGKCDFYGSHQDTIRSTDNPTVEVTKRIVTVVFYLNTEPEQFTGGELTLYEKGKEVTVKPKHNRAVVFPSFTYHKVKNVQLPDDAPFSAGRFSINHWLGFRI